MWNVHMGDETWDVRMGDESRNSVEETNMRLHNE